MITTQINYPELLREATARLDDDNTIKLMLTAADLMEHQDKREHDLLVRIANPNDFIHTGRPIKRSYPNRTQVEAAARMISLYHHGNENYTGCLAHESITIGWEKFIPQAEAALRAAREVE